MPSRRAEFRLTPTEAGTIGIKLTDGRLVIRPSISARVLSWWIAAIGTGGCIVALVVRPGGVVVWFLLAAVGLAHLLAGVRTATARVVCDDAGVVVRNHWRTVRVQPSVVEQVSADVIRWRWGRWPFSSPWSGRKVFQAVVLELREGSRVVIDASTSPPPEGGATLPNTTEIKLGALRRWMGLAAAESC